VSSEQTSTLSESDSKLLLSSYSIPFAPEKKTATAADAVAAAEQLGYPVVVKLGGDNIAHKTERGLVRLRLNNAAAVSEAATSLLAAATAADGDVHLLVAPMISGTRELIAGMLVDPQFGPTVMLGVGGVMAEVIADVAFRPAPVNEAGAAAMIDSLRMQGLLEAFRGEPAVNRQQLISVIVGLSKVAIERDDIVSVDVNPLIVRENGDVVAVDALVEMGTRNISMVSQRVPYTDAQFRALFEPRGVLVAGASTHPGKFGFVSLHNILASSVQPGASSTQECIRSLGAAGRAEMYHFLI
jgi:acetyl-CoA synthetase (ADP-forming)